MILFNKDNNCIKHIKRILNCEDLSFLNTSNVNKKTRYCDQKSLNILVCGGVHRDSLVFFSNDIFCVDVNNLKDLEVFQPMKTERGFLEAVCLKDNLYVFGGRNNYNSITSVDKYSLTSKTWSQVAEMYDNRRYFCTCAFMNMIFFSEVYILKLMKM